VRKLEDHSEKKRGKNGVVKTRVGVADVFGDEMIDLVEQNPEVEE
jgi:hypothetical protein